MICLAQPIQHVNWYCNGRQRTRDSNVQKCQPRAGFFSRERREDAFYCKYNSSQISYIALKIPGVYLPVFLVKPLLMVPRSRSQIDAPDIRVAAERSRCRRKRPFLMQSDSASRKPFRLDSSGPSSYRQSSRFYSFCALPKGGWCEGVLLYSSRNRLAALCFALSPRATAQRTLVPASWWLWA